jgi:hypothetical protein
MILNTKLIDNFLEAIFPLPKEFGVIYKYDNSKLTSFFQDAICTIDPKATIDYGMSKLVIISPNLNNVVIKIPFNGYYTEDKRKKRLNWNSFHWASGSDSKDYCLTEFEKYNRLKTYNLDCFVAKIIFYKKIHDTRIFLQEQVTPESNFLYGHEPSKKSQDLADKWYNDGKFCIDPEWIANCLDKYGESKVKRFLDYCTDIDPDILEDMHSGNFGYRKNETPCILDYSNYGD